MIELDSFKWLNESEWSVEGENIIIAAPPSSDFFNNPVSENGILPDPVGNAPFFYREVAGDFVIRVKATPDFKESYDACCIMVHQDEQTWIKAAFEKTDFNTRAVVSVVTDGVSDDANGNNVDHDSIWLQVARVNDNFAVHYSLTGSRFDMARLCRLKTDAVVKVGIQAQCPMGTGGNRMFSHLSIEQRTVDDLRLGK